MSVTTGELIQLLQLIILAFTAVIFISQFIFRFFLNNDITNVIRSVGREQMMDQLMNSVNLLFVSIGLFMVGGSSISVYLVLLGAPSPVNRFMQVFEANLYIFGIAVLAIIIVMAVYIGGDYENPHTGVKGLVTATVLTGGVSVMVIIIYITLWAATLTVEWIFFIGALSVAFAMFSLLFSAFTLGEVLLKVVEEVSENTEDRSEPVEEIDK